MPIAKSLKRDISIAIISAILGGISSVVVARISFHDALATAAKKDLEDRLRSIETDLGKAHDRIDHIS